MIQTPKSEIQLEHRACTHTHTHTLMRAHTQPHLTISPPGPVSILAPDAEKKEGRGRGILTHVSLLDVFHPDDPHCQQVAWRQLLLWIERTVDSLFG